MLNTNLLIEINPFRLAETSAELQGSLLVKDMPRLANSIPPQESAVNVKLEFGIDKHKIKYIKAQIDTHLTLVCQRCLESFDFSINSDFILGIVTTEDEIEDLPSKYEPLIVNNESLQIQEVVEEELLLNLPIVAMHDPEVCKVKLPISVGNKAEVIDLTSKENPFKVIEKLRSTPKTK